MEINLRKNKSDIINEIISEFDNEIKKSVRIFDINLRDEICQEIRIMLWKMLSKRLPEESTKEEMTKYVQDYFQSVVWFSSKPVSRKKYKEEKRNVILNSDVDTYYKDNSIERINDFSIDLSKYEKILTKKEIAILRYILETDNDFSNFDSLSRQLGYSGKGSSKYNLKKISKKMRQILT